MKQKKINWQKIGVYFLLYAVGIAAINWTFGGSVDLKSVIGVPIIAIGLLHLVNKDKFMVEED